MITSKQTTRLVIPHPDEEGVKIVGVLEQVAPEQPTRGRKIAFVSSRVLLIILTMKTSALFRSCMEQWGEYGLDLYGISS